MLDPLIYGSVEFDAPPLTMTPPKTQQHIPSLPPTTMPRAVPPLSSLPKTETDVIPSYVRPNLRELTPEDIKDVQEHTTLLQTASAKKAEDAKQRRRIRSYKSTETFEDMSTLSRRAAADGRAYICMFSPETRQTFAIRAWNELCKTLESSETTTMLHGGKAPSVDDAIGIVNREGRILTVNDEWLNLIACSGTISILKVLSELTDANILQDINSIKNGDRVLVYDTANIRCLRALTEWKCDEIHYVMPISNTGFSVACIVQKEDQTFIIHNV